MSDAAPVVRGEDNESVVVLPGLLQSLHYLSHAEVQGGQHGQVDSPVGVRHGGGDSGQVLTGYLQGGFLHSMSRTVPRN